MSRRYWLPLIAVIGLAFAASAHAQSVGDNLRGQGSPARAKSAPKAEPKTADFIAIQEDLGRITSALESANANPYATREQERAEEDLESQKEMARWAKFMLAIGGAEIILTLMGVIMIWRNLIHTRRQANAAEIALGAALRAANATVGAERDRLRVSDIYLQNIGNSLNSNEVLQWDYVHVTFQNGGRSSANIVAISVNRLVTDDLPEKPAYGSAKAINPAEQHVGASQSWQFISEGQERGHDPIEERLANEVLANDGLNYWVYGYIDYFNFVGDLERLKFCGLLDGNMLAIDRSNTRLALGGPDAYTKN